MIEIKALKRKDWPLFGPEIQKLENIAEYPYGDDFFKLDHGPDYFAFFARMGEPLFHVALAGRRVVGCAAGVLRTLKIENKTVRAWYLCDLKVDPEFRLVTTLLLKKNLFRNYLKCSRAYAVSMNPAAGENRVVKLLTRVSQMSVECAGTLNFYSFGQSTAAVFQKDLEAKIGPVSYLSLAGVKDLIMKSTGERLPLFHIQHGPSAEAGAQTPPAEGTYMICAFEDSDLDKLLKDRFPVSATASVLSHRLKPENWNFILTSDI